MASRGRRQAPGQAACLRRRTGAGPRCLGTVFRGPGPESAATGSRDCADGSRPSRLSPSPRAPVAAAGRTLRPLPLTQHRRRGGGRSPCRIVRLLRGGRRWPVGARTLPVPEPTRRCGEARTGLPSSRPDQPTVGAGRPRRSGWPPLVPRRPSIAAAQAEAGLVLGDRLDRVRVFGADAEMGLLPPERALRVRRLDQADDADPPADPAFVGGVAQLRQVLGPDRHADAVAARRAEIDQHARFAAAVPRSPIRA